MSFQLPALVQSSGIDWKNILGFIPVLLGALLKLPGLWADFHEKSHKNRTVQLQWLHDAVKDSASHLHSPNLFRELVARVAYGYSYTSDEIEFALARRNPSSTLHDIRHSRAFATMTKDRRSYAPRTQRPFNRPMNLARRQTVTDSVLLISGLAFIACVFVTAFDPLPGIGLILELGFSIWMMFEASRGVACAIRLCGLTENDLRVPHPHGHAPDLSLVQTGGLDPCGNAANGNCA
jgi:hypothetical protein